MPNSITLSLDFTDKQYLIKELGNAVLILKQLGENAFGKENFKIKADTTHIIFEFPELCESELSNRLRFRLGSDLEHHIQTLSNPQLLRGQGTLFDMISSSFWKQVNIITSPFTEEDRRTFREKERKDSVNYYQKWTKKWIQALVETTERFAQLPDYTLYIFFIKEYSINTHRVLINQKVLTNWNPLSLASDELPSKDSKLHLMIVRRAITLPDLLKEEPYSTMATVITKQTILSEREKTKEIRHKAPPLFYEDTQDITEDFIVFSVTDPKYLEGISSFDPRYQAPHLTLCADLLLDPVFGTLLPKVVLSLISNYVNPSPVLVKKMKDNPTLCLRFFGDSPQDTSIEGERGDKIKQFQQLQFQFQEYTSRPGKTYMVFNNEYDFNQACTVLNALGCMNNYRRASQKNTLEVYPPLQLKLDEWKLETEFSQCKF